MNARREEVHLLPWGGSAHYHTTGTAGRIEMQPGRGLAPDHIAPPRSGARSSIDRDLYLGTGPGPATHSDALLSGIPDRCRLFVRDKPALARAMIDRRGWTRHRPAVLGCSDEVYGADCLHWRKDLVRRCLDTCWSVGSGPAGSPLASGPAGRSTSLSRLPKFVRRGDCPPELAAMATLVRLGLVEVSDPAVSKDSGPNWAADPPPITTGSSAF